VYFANMPMLGKKQFSLAKALTNTGPGEEVFTIQHTKEQFRSKEYPFVTFRLPHPRWRRTGDNVQYFYFFRYLPIKGKTII